MDLKIDVRVAELLASRLCHDLVGPIGAVGNGLELLSDDEFGMADDAMQLTTNSARQASNILQFFRLAYGMAGARVGADYTQIRDLSAALLETSRTKLDWTEIQAPEGAPDGIAKLVLNMIALGHEALPRGGNLRVGIVSGGQGIDCTVTAAGQDAHLRPECLAGLQDEIDLDELSPRGVHGYFTRLVAKRLGSDLVIETPAPDSVLFRVTLATV
ncbi:MAG: histidine phosphotransferase family protein [Kiloniellaceae bacterium]